MLDDKVVFRNGEFVAWNEANVHIMSHSFGRGTAIFEVIGFHKNRNGRAVFRLDKYIQRFFRSARLLDMELALSEDALQQAVLDTVRRNPLEQGIIKMFGYYSQISYKILPPGQRLDVSILVFDPVQDLEIPPFVFEEGTTICISRWRKLDPQTVPVEAKVAANYLNGMMARLEAKNRGFEYAVMLDAEGYIAEGSTESVFLVKDNVLMTPALGPVLRSITRATIIRTAEVIGVKTYEGKIPSARLEEADEIFVSSTGGKVQPVRKIENRVLDGTPGPWTRKVADFMGEIVAGREERFKHWLFPI
jgi:branched-chain amino acid aminotransferase